MNSTGMVVRRRFAGTPFQDSHALAWQSPGNSRLFQLAAELLRKLSFLMWAASGWRRPHFDSIRSVLTSPWDGRDLFSLFSTVFAAIAVISLATWLVVNGGATLNRSLFILLPAGVCAYILATGSDTAATYFGFLKLLSLCVACWLIAKIRFNGWAVRDRVLIFGYLLLSVNIIEAVALEALSFLFDATGSLYGGSLWNIAAGLILVATQALPRFITVEHSPPGRLRYDLGAGWVLSYSLWNFVFVFNTLASENMFNDYVAFAVVHLSVPLLIVAFSRFDTALYIQMRAVSLGLLIALSLVWLPEPYLDPLPEWHSQHLADVVSIASFLVACMVALASLLRRTADHRPTNLLQMLASRRHLPDRSAEQKVTGKRTMPNGAGRSFRG